MRLFGASRFTVLLAVVATLATAASFWWAVATRADLKSKPSRSADRASLSKPTGHASRPKGERPNKFSSFRRNERPQPTLVWNDYPDQLHERSVAPGVFADAGPTSQNLGADMPLPLPPIIRSVRETWQTKSPEPTVFAPPQPAESQKRGGRDGTTPSSTRLAGRSYYIEKFVEQGDAREPKYRFRRQLCEPPNMPDVCFMPQESRRNIVVERQ